MFAAPAPRRRGSIVAGFALTRANALLCLALLGTCCLVGAATGTAGRHGGSSRWEPWSNWGNGLTNDHHARYELFIGADTAASLAPVWERTMIGDVAAPPAVDAADTLYVPDLGGVIWALRGDDGSVVWSAVLDELTGAQGVFDAALGRTNGTAARTTPALHGDALYFGDVNSGHVMALSKHDGSLLWMTLVEEHPAAIITMGPTVFDGLVLIGVSSVEERLAGVASYPCCSFRGSVLALDADTGAIVWKTYMTVPGYSGAAVWGSSPSVDPATRVAYVATGNNYAVPADVQACIDAHDGDGAPCPMDPANLAEAVVAIDVDTGRPLWNVSFAAQSGIDVWNIGCAPYLLGLPATPNANCPAHPGIDADFGQAPMRFHYRSGAARVPLVGVGQKNGFFMALQPATGEPVWATVVGPPGDIGGLMWGSAFDGERVYVASANSAFVNHTLKDGRRTLGGSWAALDPATGTILWQTPVPQGLGLASAAAAAAAWPLAWSPLTVANGVVFASAGSRDPTAPTMFALDAATGAILWQFVTGSATNSAPAVVAGTAYWGTGYGQMSTPGHTFYAFRPVPPHAAFGS